MYIDSFINSKYVALFRYCINLNKDNNIIVDFKYGKQNKILFLREASKNLNIEVSSLRSLLLKLRKRNNIISYRKIIKLYNKKLLKKMLRKFRILIRKVRINFKEKKKQEVNFIKSWKKKLNIAKLFKYRLIKKHIKSFYLINANVNLNPLFKKIKMLRFIVHKLLHNQVLGNALLLDGFLGLNLHGLFVRRFKYHFVIFFKNEKKKFNYNKFNFILFNKLFFKINRLGSFILNLSRLKLLNGFFDTLYRNVVNKLRKFITFDLNFKHFNKFKNYLLNWKNINYIKFSFKLTIFKNKNKKKVRRSLRKFKRLNLFYFFNLAFLKLIVFLFLYWFNNLIILFNIKIKSNILIGWFKPIGFIFKKYIWRKKIRNYYLKYNEINNLIFFNYKNILLKSCVV